MGQLITEEYRALQEALHRNPDYGMASVGYAPIVAETMRKLGAQELLDYGAGKGRLGIALRDYFPRHLSIHHYDPAVPEWSRAPKPCRFVACVDVLEHIEPDCLEAVLDDLKRVIDHVGLFTVHTGPAIKVLADGRNAHLIQQPSRWWLPKLQARWDLMAFNKSGEGFWVVVKKLKEPNGE